MPVQASVDVQVPVRQAYNQWTQFEDFPQFMDNVEHIQQVTDTRTHWKVQIAGVEREFDAEITEQEPDQRIAWQSTGGTKHAGVVTFHRLGDNQTRVTLQMEVEPSDWAEKAADVLQVTERQARDDMENFKKFIEERGQETGAWRGEVPQDPDA